MKKSFIVLSVLTCSILTACTSKEDKKESNISSIAEQGVDIIKPPEGCKIVFDSDEFHSITQNQEYQFESDHNTRLETVYGVSDGGEVMYSYFDGNLFYYNKTEGSNGLLCSKPDCEHNSNSCVAVLFEGMGLQYYEGNLYTLMMDNMTLMRLKTDGTERATVCSLFGVDEESVKKRVDSPGRTCNWMIHRGYIYYIYQYESGNTEDIFYLNGSNCLWRMAVDGSGEPECIMPLVSESKSTLIWLKAYGSYVYFNVPEKESSWGTLYRYNVESNEIEVLEGLENKMYGYIVNGNEILYNVQKNYNIYKYNLETGENSIFYEGSEPYTIVQSDEDYICAMYVSESLSEGEKSRVDIFDWDGNKVATISMLNKDNPDGTTYIDSFCGGDNSKIYFSRRVVKAESNPWGLNRSGYMELCYIEKEDLIDGEYEIHEVK